MLIDQSAIDKRTVQHFRVNSTANCLLSSTRKCCVVGVLVKDNDNELAMTHVLFWGYYGRTCLKCQLLLTRKYKECARGPVWVWIQRSATVLASFTAIWSTLRIFERLYLNLKLYELCFPIEAILQDSLYRVLKLCNFLRNLLHRMLNTDSPSRLGNVSPSVKAYTLKHSCSF